MIDLHMHTDCSDGQFSPEKTVQLAHEAGVTTLAITDHDATDGIAPAQKAAMQYGMRFFPGVEISVKGEKELHILGYGIDPHHAEMCEFFADFQRERAARAVRIVEYLKRRGVSVTLDDVRRYNAGQISGRPHFAKTLVAMGYVSSVKEAFARYLTTPEFYAHVERPKPSPERGLEVIRNAGGVAVLAHPYLLHMELSQFESILQQLISFGLQGIEVYHSRHTPECIMQYLQLAKQYNLLVTCGSDFHGPAVKPDIFLGSGANGNLCITDETIPNRLAAAIDLRKKEMRMR